MLGKIAIALAAASLFGAASIIPTDVLAARHGGGGGHGGGGHAGIGGGGRHGGGGFAGRGFGGGRFHGGRFGNYGTCYAWTPYGRRWICD